MAGGLLGQARLGRPRTALGARCTLDGVLRRRQVALQGTDGLPLYRVRPLRSGASLRLRRFLRQGRRTARSAELGFAAGRRVGARGKWCPEHDAAGCRQMQVLLQQPA